jgi:hypothetical protein
VRPINLLAVLPFIGILVGTPAIIYAVDPANKEGDAE